MIRLLLIGILTFLLSSTAFANRAIMEGVPAQNKTIWIDTTAVSVGIGTTNPKSLGNLVVAGSAHISTLTVPGIVYLPTVIHSMGSSMTVLVPFFIRGAASPGTQYVFYASTAPLGDQPAIGILNTGSDIVVFGATSTFNAQGAGNYNFTLFPGSSTVGGNASVMNLQMAGYRATKGADISNIQFYSGRDHFLGFVSFMTGQVRADGGQFRVLLSSGTIGANPRRIFNVSDTGHFTIGQDDDLATFSVVPVPPEYGTPVVVVKFATSTSPTDIGFMFNGYGISYARGLYWGDITGAIFSSMTTNGSILLAPTASLRLGNIASVTDAGNIAYNQSANDLVIGNGSSSGTVVMGSWRSYTPTFGGFSSPPTVTAKYTLIGKTCILKVITLANGTSNATNFTITLPYPSKSSDDGVNLTSRATDGGSALTTPPRLDTNAGSSTANAYSSVASTAWTASGAKSMNFTAVYEIE